MKRSVIFLSILILLLAAAVLSEYFYSVALENKAQSIIQDDSQNTHVRLSELMQDKKALNKLFFPKSKTERIINEINKLKIYEQNDDGTQVLVQKENLRYLIKGLCRFNEKGT